MTSLPIILIAAIAVTVLPHSTATAVHCRQHMWSNAGLSCSYTGITTSTAIDIYQPPPGNGCSAPTGFPEAGKHAYNAITTCLPDHLATRAPGFAFGFIVFFFRHLDLSSLVLSELVVRADTASE